MPPTKLQPESARLGHGRGEARRQARRLEGNEERLRPPGESRQASPAVGDPRRRRAGVRPRREVDHEDVDRPRGEEHAGERESLVERFRRQHDEPIEADATRRRFDRVERPGEVQPRDDRAVGLRLGDEAERERRRPG